MALTCLAIIQECCRRIGILPPNVAVTSTDAQINQIVSISQEAGKNLAEYPWESLQLESTFTTVATQLQGTMESLAPGWKFVLNNTIWDRTLRRPVRGSRTPREWQEAVAMQLTSPWSLYRIKGDSLYFFPIPAAGDTCAFEYVSKNWITLAAGGTAEVWGSDDDTPLISDELLILSTIWRWKETKGLEFSGSFSKYERTLIDAKAKDASKQILDANGGCDTITPGVFIPAGSWDVP